MRKFIIDCRVSDAVRYLRPEISKDENETLYKILCDEGFGNVLQNEDKFIKNLMNRGLSKAEAQEQFIIEKNASEYFKNNGKNLNTVFAPTMMITCGIKK